MIIKFSNKIINYMKELKDLKVDVGDRIAKLTVSHGHFLVVSCWHIQNENVPMAIEAPEFITDALHEFEKENDGFRVKTLLYQRVNFAVYSLERIL